MEIANALDKKEEYKYSDHDDLDYFGIKGIENLFEYIEDSEYCRPILVKSNFKNSYQYYEITGDRSKKVLVKQ